MRQIAEFIAALACALFTGAAVYVHLVLPSSLNVGEIHRTRKHRPRQPGHFGLTMLIDCAIIRGHRT
jgi:hypothetical protein